jgi:hypothetical protein
MRGLPAPKIRKRLNNLIIYKKLCHQSSKARKSPVSTTVAVRAADKADHWLLISFYFRFWNSGKSNFKEVWR